MHDGHNVIVLLLHPRFPKVMSKIDFVHNQLHHMSVCMQEVHAC